jgi:hypothetical protein
VQAARESEAAQRMTSPPWLLLAHQLPARASNARVKIWRRLRQVGAVPTRNSVYVLPNTDQCREDLEWIRTEIVAVGGEATVFTADAVNRDGSDELVAAFQRARDADYQALKRRVGRLVSPARSAGRSGARRDKLRRAARISRARFSEIEQIDFFHASGRQGAADAVVMIERLVAERPGRSTPTADAQLSETDFRDRRWVTRPRPGVDRMASAWLIRRFIDPSGTFEFVDHPEPSDIPFDMYVGEFSHHGSSCTFETLAQRFGLSGPAVTRIGQIVHDLDMKDTRYAPPEAPAVGRMVDGLRQLHADDHVLLEHGMAMFEALARSFDTVDAVPASRRKGKRHA